MGTDESWIVVPPPTAMAALNTERDDHWRHFDNSVDAVSFGFVATAILISMFLVMAIFERFLRQPPPPPSSTLPMTSSADLEAQFALHGKLSYPSPKEIVDKMMAQQEEMQNKLIEDMVKRDQEKLAWEEAWKKREMDRINHELQLRVDEQALAGDRQASIIKFLENFTSSTATNAVTNSAAPLVAEMMLDYQIKKAPMAIAENDDDKSNRNSTSSSSSAAKPNTNSSGDELSLDRSNRSVPPKNSSRNSKKSLVSNSGGGELAAAGKEEVGKRWPRDDMLALINLRCGIHNQDIGNNAGGSNEGEGTNDGGGAGFLLLFSFSFATSSINGNSDT